MKAYGKGTVIGLASNVFCYLCKGLTLLIYVAAVAQRLKHVVPSVESGHFIRLEMLSRYRIPDVGGWSSIRLRSPLGHAYSTSPRLLMLRRVG